MLKEFIEYAKHDSAILTANMFAKRLNVDFVNGQGKSIELLNEHFYEVISDENLNEQQIIKLAKEVSTRETNR